MNLFTRLLMILAVAIFAASPVMACCLNNHVEASAETHSVDATPCHGEAEPTASKPISDNNLEGCPGCAECETAMLQAQTADPSAVLASGQELQLMSLQGDQWTGFNAPLVVRTTGPPHDLSRVPDTPITLKQRFLI
jgi:hypothetical protein